jgi:hypothetical protein
LQFNAVILIALTGVTFKALICHLGEESALAVANGIRPVLHNLDRPHEIFLENHGAFKKSSGKATGYFEAWWYPGFFGKPVRGAFAGTASPSLDGP